MLFTPSVSEYDRADESPCICQNGRLSGPNAWTNGIQKDTASPMDFLIFRGSVKKGSGHYKDLIFPHREKIAGAPEDWPGHNLFRGSLNIRIDEDGYPENFHELGYLPFVRRLDNKYFKPKFVIPQAAIANNLLTPEKTGITDGGDAQVWLANLQVCADGKAMDCWLVRRIGSGLLHDLELVSDIHLRSSLSLEKDGAKVTIKVAGTLIKKTT